jgi:hypothetical protein
VKAIYLPHEENSIEAELNKNQKRKDISKESKQKKENPSCFLSKAGGIIVSLIIA